MKEFISENEGLVISLLEIPICGDSYDFPKIIQKVSPENPKDLIKKIISFYPETIEEVLKEREMSKEKLTNIKHLLKSENFLTYLNSTCGMGFFIEAHPYKNSASSYEEIIPLLPKAFLKSAKSISPKDYDLGLQIGKTNPFLNIYFKYR